MSIVGRRQVKGNTFAIAASIVNLNIRRRSHRSVLAVFNLLQGYSDSMTVST